MTLPLDSFLSGLIGKTLRIRLPADFTLASHAGITIDGVAEPIPLYLPSPIPNSRTTPMPTYPIVGAGFRPPAKAILQVLPLGAALTLRREPGNLYDANAIQVICPTSSIPDDSAETLDLLAQGFGFDIGTIMQEPEWHLGYIPRTMALGLAPQWDEAGMTQAPAGLVFNAKGEPRAEWDGAIVRDTCPRCEGLGWAVPQDADGIIGPEEICLQCGNPEGKPQP